MRHIFQILSVFFLMQPAVSQVPFSSLLDTVALNNKSLSAARQLAESQKLSAKTGIYLDNPTVSFDRLSNATGNYSEMLISQSFDFPSTYVHKSKIAGLSSRQADEQLRKEKLDVLTSFVQVYTELVYINRRISLLSKRLEMSQRLLVGVEKRLTLGDANVFENNRVKSEAAKTHSEFQLAESRRKTLQFALAELNGGKTITVGDTLYPVLHDFQVNDSTPAAVSANSPIVKQWEARARVADRNVYLQKSLSLPKFEIGYRQDITTGQTFNGIHAGVTIPLFENKNSVKSAKANYLYTAEATNASRLEVQSNIKQFIEEYKTLQHSVSRMNEIFGNINTPGLLMKAYDIGQISYTEFFAEHENYHSTKLYIEDLQFKAETLKLVLYIYNNL